MTVLVAGCDRSKPPARSASVVSENERIRLAQEDLARANNTLNQIPRLDLILRATRQFVILRQVELSDEPLDWKTQRDLEDAKSRAAAVLPEIAKFAPLLRNIEDALLELRGSLHRVAQESGTDLEVRAAIGRCRSQAGGLLDDLDLALRVLTEPDSVFPKDSDYYDPDFAGTLEEIGIVLNQAGKEARDIHPKARK